MRTEFRPFYRSVLNLTIDVAHSIVKGPQRLSLSSDVCSVRSLPKALRPFNAPCLAVNMARFSERIQADVRVDVSGFL